MIATYKGKNYKYEIDGTNTHLVSRYKDKADDSFYAITGPFYKDVESINDENISDVFDVDIFVYYRDEQHDIPNLYKVEGYALDQGKEKILVKSASKDLKGWEPSDDGGSQKLINIEDVVSGKAVNNFKKFEGTVFYTRDVVETYLKNDHVIKSYKAYLETLL